jgi:hypothetical protein
VIVQNLASLGLMFTNNFVIEQTNYFISALILVYSTTNLYRCGRLRKQPFRRENNIKMELKEMDCNECMSTLD